MGTAGAYMLHCAVTAKVKVPPKHCCLVPNLCIQLMTVYLSTQTSTHDGHQREEPYDLQWHCTVTVALSVRWPELTPHS